MKSLFLPVLLASFLALGSCTCSHENNVSPFYGTYSGIIPAADCEGIQVTLTINEDTTYCLTRLYLKEGQIPEIFSGVYEVMDDGRLSLVRPSSGERTYYKVVEDAVIMTDVKGNLPEGDLAPLYVLKKKETENR